MNSAAPAIALKECRAPMTWMFGARDDLLRLLHAGGPVERTRLEREIPGPVGDHVGKL